MNARIILASCWIVLNAGCGQQPEQRAASQQSDIQVFSSAVLSTNGSTRATAYTMSNKIITANGKIFIAWLDHVADILIKEYDIQNDHWSEAVLIGKGVDNHSGPAITMNEEGYIYAVFGPHHAPFQFTRTTNPHDVSQWQPVEHFGDTATYPSLVCGPDGTLHCTYRGGPEPWRLMYQQKPKNGKWSEPVALVHPGVEEGYTQYGNPIAVSADGALHVGFHIYDVHPNGGKSIGYLRSRDNGQTWQSAEGQTLELPVNPQSPCFVEQDTASDMRIGTLTVDGDGHPWFAVAHLERRPRSAVLWHHDGETWQSRDLLNDVRNALGAVETTYASLSFDREGVLFIVAAVGKENAEKFWGDQSLEIVLLVSQDRGKTFSVTPISKVAPNLPNWLPSIERPYGAKPIGIPSFLYTHGGPGTTVTDGEATEVIFVRLHSL